MQPKKHEHQQYHLNRHKGDTGGVMDLSDLQL